MNEIDKKVLEYLDRADEIVLAAIHKNARKDIIPLHGIPIQLDIAKMIQLEEHYQDDIVYQVRSDNEDLL